MRSLFPTLWANECRRGNTDPISSAIPSFESRTSTLGFASPSDYFASCFSSTTEGYNSHLYKYIQTNAFGGLNVPTSTRSYINTTSFSWANKLGSQPLLLVALQIQQIFFLNTSLQPMMTLRTTGKNIWCCFTRSN